MVDIAAIPHRLEDTVRKPKYEDVLYSFFSEIVINAVNLVFLYELKKVVIQLPRGSQVVPERLLHDEAAPRTFFLIRQATHFQLFHNIEKHIGGSCKVVEVISSGPAFLVHGIQNVFKFEESTGIVIVPCEIAESIDHPVTDAGFEVVLRSMVRANRFANSVSEL